MCTVCVSGMHRSKDWETVDKAEIKRLELKKAEDGEFW